MNMTTIEYLNKAKNSSENPLEVYKRTKVKVEGICFKSIVNDIEVVIKRQYLEEVSDPNDGIIRRCSSCNKILSEESYLIKGNPIDKDEDAEFICCKKCEYNIHFKGIYNKWTGKQDVEE